MPGPAHLRAQAQKCRTLATRVIDSETAATLNRVADDYEREARTLEVRVEPVNRVPS